MKKIILTSLLTVFAVSSANAANIINDNPLYRPSKGHFYSVTSLDTGMGYDNEAAADYRTWIASETFGYGITDKLSLYIDTAATATYPQGPTSQDNYAWNNLGLTVNYRGIDSGVAKMDVYAGMKQLYSDDTGFATTTGLETIANMWTVGTKAGVVMKDWTLAGTAEYNYWSDDMSGVNYDFSTWNFGLDGQYEMSSNWNITAGLLYTFVEADRVIEPVADAAYGDGDLTGKLGINYNIDSQKYVGVYTAHVLNADTNKDMYKVGVKFGMDF